MLRQVLKLGLVALVLTFGCVDDFLDDDSPPKSAKSSQPRPPKVDCYGSFSAFKRNEGKAGDGMHWHHLVQKHKRNEARFGPRKLHCTDNVIRLDSKIHKEISAWYSSKQDEADGQVVRDWQAPFTFLEQRAYAIKTLYKYGGKLPSSWTK